MKNSPLTFSHNSKSLATLKQSQKKIDVTLILSIIEKEKSDRIAKSKKRFWFLNILVAFVIACIVLMMRIGFFMSKTCVHK